MSWTRREVMCTLAGGAAALQFGPSFAFEDPAGTRFGEFPLAALVKAFQEEAGPRAPKVMPSGLGRTDYLRRIRGIVRFFAAHQDARGAIIDPYEKKERQYSTPAFALGVAALCAAGGDADLLPAGVQAMESACADLADGRASDGHADFFTVLLVHADVLFREVVTASAAKRWRENLARIQPETIYRRQPTAADVNNWNLVAASGEWLRTREKFGSSQAWVDRSIERQLEHVTSNGMYRDPNDPMAYDHFARLWVLDMLDEGYKGPQAAVLDSLMERGAWASLFMQSPHGELPCGGRSAHHQWNEAQQAVTFESFARRFAKRGNPIAAGACKRAAHLSLKSIGRWVRPSGELWIVKNRMDPALRHGYEAYSYHSQYNLLTAAMLAIAWVRADDSIPEGACPAETGGFAFELAPAFHKVFINQSGTYVEIDTGADLHYNPTGILRVHHRNVSPEILSDGITAQCDYRVPAKPAQSFAFGPAWQDRDGRWHSLAEHGATDLAPVAVTIAKPKSGACQVDLSFIGRLRGGASVVRERVTVASGEVSVEDRVEGAVSAVRQVRPWLAFDGVTRRPATLLGPASRTRVGSNELNYVSPPDDSGTQGWLADGSTEAACRNGFAQASYVEGKPGAKPLSTTLYLAPIGSV